MSQEEADEPAGVRLIDLTWRCCRWPLGDPRQDEFRFCGEPKQTGSVYCAGHHQLAYRPRPELTCAEAKAQHVKNLQMLVINTRKAKGY